MRCPPHLRCRLGPIEAPPHEKATTRFARLLLNYGILPGWITYSPDALQDLFLDTIFEASKEPYSTESIPRRRSELDNWPAMAMAGQSLIALSSICPAPPAFASNRVQVCGLSSSFGGAKPLHGQPFAVLELRHQQYYVLRAVADSDQASGSTAERLDLPPPGCSRVKLEISKPLGMVLEEDKTGNIFVAGLIDDGNAAKSGLVDVGDQLIATSAIVYNDAETYQGVKVRKGMEIVRLNVRGERFETVMAAIGTHPAHIKVALELQKCKPS